MTPRGRRSGTGPSLISAVAAARWLQAFCDAPLRFVAVALICSLSSSMPQRRVPLEVSMRMLGPGFSGRVSSQATS